MNVDLKLRSMPAFLCRWPVYFARIFAIHWSAGQGFWISCYAALSCGVAAVQSHAKILRRSQGGVFLSIGTKSVLYGYHCFFIHPFLVAWAWWKLYGFPSDPRLWVAFVVHDWGYWGKPNMDGPEGETHPFTGAEIMGRLFDYRDQWGHKRILCDWYTAPISIVCNFFFGRGQAQNTSWYCFTFYHSRFLAKRYGIDPSKLCVADKFAIIICPAWLQLFLMRLTGEQAEYIKGQGGRTNGENKKPLEWCKEMQTFLATWLEQFFFDCSRCSKTFSTHDLAPIVLPPHRNSTDGLPLTLCPKCGAAQFADE